MTVRLRPAREDEKEALQALLLRASLAWGDHTEALLNNPDAVEIPSEHLAATFVAETEGRIVGFATVLPRDDDQAELDAIFVEPEAWRRGVGGRLLDEAVRRAMAFGADVLHVIANPRAVGFYEARGFRVVGEVMTRFAPAPEMRRELDRKAASSSPPP